MFWVDQDVHRVCVSFNNGIFMVVLHAYSTMFNVKFGFRL